ncbi:capsular polysaccharide synthesis protein [Sphingobacterium suaedae]|uniref:Capsular polysaccharide synthesis protein n=1 Tax=Sphingobacterium suaedae TaxID=1686402 RepID=A0ABW5KPI9_9SPHI
MDSKFVCFMKGLAANLLKGRQIHLCLGAAEKDIVLNKDKTGPLRSVPKKVWIYWDSQKIPYTVQTIIDINRDSSPDYEFVVLTPGNVFDFIPEVDFPKDLLRAHKADYIRLQLLALYGGVWVDATTILIEGLGWIEKVNNDRQFDLLGYYRDKSTLDYSFPIVETWFLAAPPENRFILLWLELFSPILDYGSTDFFQQLKSRKDYALLSQRMSDPSYLLLNLCEQQASRELGDVNMFLKRCEDSAFYIQEQCEWDFNRINFVLCRQQMPLERYRIIKLTSRDREFTDYYRKWGLIDKGSIIGQLLQKQISNV